MPASFFSVPEDQQRDILTSAAEASSRVQRESLAADLLQQRNAFDDEIAFYAFRYALGRKIYAVQSVTEYLIA